MWVGLWRKLSTEELMLLNYGVGEESLEWQEIQPVHSKGNQSWMFFGRTDAKAETPMSQLFAWGGQNIGVSASTSVLPMNIQDWFPLEWTAWISFQSKGLSRVFNTTAVLVPIKNILISSKIIFTYSRIKMIKTNL